MNDYRNTAYKDLVQQVNVVEMAAALGYAQDNKESYRGTICMRLDDRDKIYISPSRKNSSEQHFWDPRNGESGNGVMFFLKRALEKGYCSDIAPQELDWKRKVAAILCQHVNMPLEQRNILKTHIPLAKAGEPFNDEAAKKLIMPADYITFLSKYRRIVKETFRHPLFDGTFYNTNPDADSRRKLTDIAFPCSRLDGSLGGLNIRYYNNNEYKCSSVFFPGSEHGKTIWHSNVPEKIDSMFIGESELDCMAHFQLKQDPNTLYVSHQGYLMDSQVDVIFDYLKQNKDRLSPDFKLMLGGDNDMMGSKYDLKFIIASAQKFDDSVERKCSIHDKDVPCDLPDHHTVAVTARTDLYEGFRTHAFNYVVQNIPNLDLRFDDANKTVFATLPNNDKFADDALSDLLINSKLLSHEVVREKAIEKDWNDDVKKLHEINYKIQATLNMKKELDYPTFRELYPQYRLNCKAKEFLENVVKTIADQLPESPRLIAKAEQEAQQEADYWKKTHPKFR